MNQLHATHGTDDTTGAAATADSHNMSDMSTTQSTPDDGGMSGNAEGMSGTADGMGDTDQMDSMSSGDHMGGSMSMSGPDLFPSWVMFGWIAALSAVLVLHIGYLFRMAGQHRWFHLAHVAMIVGMIYMYAMMEFKLKWVSGPVWVWFYTVTTAAILVWMIVRIVTRKPFSYLWVLALLQQAAMIYMWIPMSSWVPWFSYLLTAYFAVEALVWLFGRISDVKPGRGFEVGPGPRGEAVRLGHTSFLSNLSMAVMAASMSYMFLGMQLMA